MKRAALLAVALLALTAASAFAGPPPGEWTYLRTDPAAVPGYSHYACKSRGHEEGRWRLRTASYDRGNRHLRVVVLISRRSDPRGYRARSSRDWSGHYLFMSLRGLRASDHVWAQVDGYGETNPYDEGTSMRRITRCDIR